MSSSEKTSAASPSPPSDDLGPDLGATHQPEKSKTLIFSNGKSDQQEESIETEGTEDTHISSIPMNKSESSIIKENGEEMQKPTNARPAEPPPAEIAREEGTPIQKVKKITIIPNGSGIPSKEQAASSAVPESSTDITAGNKNSSIKLDSPQSIDTAIFKYCTYCRNAFLRQEQLDSHMRSYHPDKYKDGPDSTSEEKNSEEIKSPTIPPQPIPKEKLPPPPPPTPQPKSTSISTIPEKVPQNSPPPPLLTASTKSPATPPIDKVLQRPPPLQPKAIFVSSSPTILVNSISKTPELPNEKPDVSPVEQVPKKLPCIPPPPQPFICNECGKKFLVKTNYDEHLKTHEQEFKTPLPPAKSEDSTSTMNIAKEEDSPEQVSTPPPPRKVASGLKCEFCDRIFPQPFLLRKHMEIHNQQYECSICSARYMKIEGLNLHKRVLHDEAGMNKFKCLLCDKKDFILMSEWYSHRLEKHGQVPFQAEREKPFACNVCQQRFHRKGDAYVCALLGHDPTSLYDAMFRHKCPECSEDEGHLGYHSIRAMKKHWATEHPDKVFPTDVLLAENGYSFDAPLPKVVIDKREVYDLMTNGPPSEEKQEDGTPLILEFDRLSESEMKSGGEGCVISVFVCPDCPLTFVDVESLTIHEQVHLQDEGPPSSSSSTSDARKRGRPPTKQPHFVTMSTDATSPVAPISLLPTANGFRGKHLVAKFKCVTCGKKFRKLKRLREHELTHPANLPKYPKLPNRGGRKGSGMMKKIKSSTFLSGGIVKKRGRPRKIPFWVPSAAAAQQMRSGGGVVDSSSALQASEEDSVSPESSSSTVQKAYRCKICHAGFSIPKSLRMHELKIHKAPRRKPGRKPGNQASIEAEDTEAVFQVNSDDAAATTVTLEANGEPRILAPGRIRVGRMEISTKLNKIIKQNSPIQIRVTDENGGSATHLQCPSCPKIFRDKRGIHLHMLGHSLKSKDYKEEKEKKPKEEKGTEEYQGKKSYQSPSAISSAHRRTSDRERRVPRKLSEYDVDDEEAAAAVGGATMEVESTVPSVPPPQKVKKDGRGRPRKYPLPPAVESIKSNNGADGPTTSFKEISGEIIGSRPRSKTLEEEKPETTAALVTRRMSEDADVGEDEHDDDDDDYVVSDSDDDEETEPPPPPPPRPRRLECKTCGDTFDSVMELWCHGNEVHRKTKVKYVPNAAAAAATSKTEEKKAGTEVVPETCQPSTTPGQQNLEKPINKIAARPNVYPGKKNPAVLALLQKKRQQLGMSSNINGVTAPVTTPESDTPTKTVADVEVPLKEEGGATAKVKVAEPAKQELTAATVPGIVVVEPRPPKQTVLVKTVNAAVKPKGRPPKKRLPNDKSLSSKLPALNKEELERGVVRIGQLKIAPEMLNKSKQLLEKEPPEIIIKTTEDGQVIKRNKCPRCPKTFKDFRGLPFHMLCHIMKAEGKTKKSRSLLPTTSPIPPSVAVEAKTEDVDVVIKKEDGEQDKMELSPEKSEKKLPGLIPLGGLKKRGRPQKWIVNPFQKKRKGSPLASSNGVKKAKTTHEEPLPSTSRTSSIQTTTGAAPKVQSSSENKIPPPQITIKPVLEVESSSNVSSSSSAEAVPKPILSPSSNEFRFKIIKQSRILPFDDQLNQQQQVPPAPPPAAIVTSAVTANEPAANNEGRVKSREISKKIEEAVGKAKIAAPAVPIPAVTSLQTEPSQVDEIQKKKAKMSAILAKAKIDTFKTPVAAAASSSTTSSSQVNGSFVDIKKEEKVAEKKVGVNTDIKPAPKVEEKEGTSEKQTTSTCSPETGTLKRKRGRPRKDSVAPSPAVVATCPKPQPVEGRSPSKEEINLSIDAEMEALQKIERDLKEQLEMLGKATPAADASEGLTLIPVKKKGRPLKKKKRSAFTLKPVEPQKTEQVDTSSAADAAAAPTPEATSHPTLKRKQGRPRKTPKELPAAEVETHVPPAPTPPEESSPLAAKRGRGRPRKYPVASSASVDTTAADSIDVPVVAAPNVIKVPNSIISPDITSFMSPYTSSSVEAEEQVVIKRGRGRPRKSMPILTRADDNVEDEPSSQ